MPSSTSTVTVLFCDIVGSTARRAELGETDADRFFVSVEQRFRQVIDDAGGRVLKGGGDGVMAQFDAASDAIGAAIELQRRTAIDTPDIRLRVGVAAGDVTWDGDDCFGMPVVVAARLESVCEPGCILVSGIVRALAGSRAAVDYTSVGELDLKGVPDPVEAFDVAWTAVVDADTDWTFPSILPTSSQQPMVGRHDETRVLTRRWAEVVGGDSGLVLVAGEAGAGKTRLVTEFARRAHDGGALVVAGVCDRDLSLAYQPWVMVLDQIVGQLPEAVIDVLRPRLSDLLVVAPGIGERISGLARPERLDPEDERVRMYEAVIAVLHEVTTIAPVLVVVDDLHWGGAQTLDLLRHVVRGRRHPRCLVVATHRDAADEIDAPLAAALADFRRVDGVEHVVLGGIGSDAVAELLDTDDGGLADVSSVAEEIVARTAGNAFLVTELVRAGTHGAGEVPSSVTDVVRSRMHEVSDDARFLARVVAVAGRPDLRVLGEVARRRDVHLRGAMEELVGGGLVQELDGPLPAYQFAHALIRDAVDESATTFDRVELHHLVAEAIEATNGADRRPVLPALARHYAAAAPVAGWDKAAYYGGRAVVQAQRTAAYDEAVELADAALAVIPVGTEDRVRLLVDVAELLQRCGRAAEAVSMAAGAVDDAAELGDPVLEARAAIELERSAHLANSSLDLSPSRLRRVLHRSSELPEDVRVRVRASYGRAGWLNGLPDSAATAGDALAAARRLDDPETVAHALEMSCVIETDAATALDLARELESVTNDLGRVFQSMWAMTRQTDALVTLGRLDEARHVLERLRSSADRYRFTSYRYLAHVFSHTLALAAADFEAAEAAAEAADTAEGTEFAGLDASGAYGLQMFMVRRAQGKLEEMRPVLQILARNSELGGIWRPGLVSAYLELGMVDEARAGFDELVTEHWTTVARDALWPLALMFLAEACVALDRSDPAPMLLAELDSYAGVTIRAGYTTNGGPADRCRAMLAALAGDDEGADRAIRSAHELARSSRSPVWLAATEAAWARILARRGEHDAAIEHHRQAQSLAERYGIGCLTTTAPLPGSAGSSVDGGEVGSPEAPADETSRAADGPAKPDMTSAMSEPPDGLSEREVEVLRELAAGCTNRQIAERLYISPNTAANHVRAILRKTGCGNRTEAAAYAFRHGLGASPPPS